jgi:hypothetical protein
MENPFGSRGMRDVRAFCGRRRLDRSDSEVHAERHQQNDRTRPIALNARPQTLPDDTVRLAH